MLGRTNSRRRLLVLLMVFVVGSLALFARTAYWQVVNGDFLMARRPRPRPRSGSRSPAGAARSTTGPARSCWPRRRPRPPGRRRRPARPRPGRRARGPATSSSACSSSTTPRPRPSARSSASERPYVVLARGIEPSVAERIRQALRDERIVARRARGRAGAGLPAGRRRPRVDPRRPPARLRQPRERRPVRRRAVLPGRARRRRRGSWSPSATSTAGRCPRRRWSRRPARSARTSA